MNTRLDFFDRIKDLTKKRNMTIESMLELAFANEDDRITRGVYNGWRSRGVYPRADQAAAIARALNTSVEALLSGNHEEKAPPSFDTPELKAVFQKLNLYPEIVPKVNAYIDGLIDQYGVQENNTQNAG